jgi:hypothetical protein
MLDPSNSMQKENWQKKGWLGPSWANLPPVSLWRGSYGTPCIISLQNASGIGLVQVKNIDATRVLNVCEHELIKSRLCCSVGRYSSIYFTFAIYGKLTTRVI